MNKNRKRVYTVLIVIFIVFSVIAFAAPFGKSYAGFWLSYLFGVISIGFQVYVYNISLADESVKSKFYGFPIARIGAFYLVAQIILSLIEMILCKVIPVWVIIILNVILLALTFIGCIAAETMKEEIERQDEVLKKNVSNIRNLQSLSASIVNQCSENVKKAVSDLAEEFRYSDPVSCDDSLEIEEELDVMLKELQKAVIDEDDSSVEALCKKILASLEERNRICKLGKGRI